MLSILLSLLLIVAPPAAAQVERIAPLDHCAGDDAFAAFRAELEQAIARKDAERLLAIVSDDIEIDFGGGAGRAQFAETWALDTPETSPVWEELAAVLRLGCAREPEGGYWMPSMFMAEGYEDGFTAAVAIRPGATVHASPDPDSPVVATLDWDLLTVAQWQWEAPWQSVEMADGRIGHVRTGDIRSPIDYRALFAPVDGRWRMTVFIAGD
jgi:hypothetical protein